MADDTNASEGQAQQSNQAAQTPSETALPSRDVFGLGRTSGQRGAEILAGFRAEYLPSPEHKALSRMSGRVIARLILSTTRSSGAMNYTLGRPHVIDHLIQETLATVDSPPVIVEIAAGLSPRGLRMAQALPEATFIEVDLPDVVAEKQKRIQAPRDLTVPPNLKWITADLAVTPFSEVMDGRKAHVICAEGLVGYLRHPQIVTLSRSVRETLHPGGAFITDLGLQAGVKAIKQAASMFSRQAGNWYGTVDDIDHGKRLMHEAGFEDVKAYLPSELVETLDLRTPMLDISCFLRASSAGDTDE